MTGSIGIHTNKTDIAGKEHRDIADALLADLELCKWPTIEDIDNKCAQIFIAGPRKLHVNIDDHIIGKLRSVIRSKGLKLMIHGTYLDRPWAQDVGNHIIKSIQGQLSMANKMEAYGPVIHLSPETLNGSLEKVYDSIFTDSKGSVDGTLIFEVYAKKPGKESYDSLDKLIEFARKTREIEPMRQFGICIDTAHMYESGIDFSSQDICHEFFTRATDELYLENNMLPFMHLNDSKTPLGSGIDQHASLGHGYIWKDYKGRGGVDKKILSSLQEVIDFIKETSCPAILERDSEALNLDFETLSYVL
jgi:deoxyribonuclease-4